MPRNQSQRMVFAFLTVLITVHAYALEILLEVPAPSVSPAENLTPARIIP